MIGAKTRATISAAAAVSGLLTYSGFTLDAAVDDWYFKTVCALTAIVISLAMSTFWAHAFGIMPYLSKGRARWSGWSTTLSGVLLILAFSTYWNLVFLSGGIISQEMSKGVTARAEAALALSAERSNRFGSYLTDLRAFENATKSIRQREIRGQGLSDVPGEGPLSDFMGQAVDAISTVLASVQTATGTINALQAEGETCLSDLRRHLSVSDMEAAGRALTCVNRTISGIAGQDVLASIERSLRNLTSGIVVPSTIRTASQRQNVRNFIAKRQAQANRIADQIAAEPPIAIPSLSLQRDSLMKGILTHWSSIIPQIATATSVDLLPLVLLFFQTVRGDDQRGRGKPRQVWTAADLEDALLQMDSLRGTRSANPMLDLPEDGFIDLGEGEYEDVDVTARANDSDDRGTS